MDFTLILLLIAFNAVFALSEMAIVASRSARLQHLEDEAATGCRRRGGAAPGARRASCRRSRSASPPSACWRAPSARRCSPSRWRSGSRPVPLLAPHARRHRVHRHGGAHHLPVGRARRARAEAPRAARARARRAGRRRRRCAGWSALPPRSSGCCRNRATPCSHWCRSRAEREPPVTDEEIAVLMEQGAPAGVFHAQRAGVRVERAAPRRAARHQHHDAAAAVLRGGPRRRPGRDPRAGRRRAAHAARGLPRRHRQRARHRRGHRPAGRRARGPAARRGRARARSAARAGDGHHHVADRDVPRRGPADRAGHGRIRRGARGS